MPEGRYGMGVVGVMDWIYLVGGQDAALPVQGFFALREEWQQADPPVLVPWSRMGAVSWRTHLYVFGGEIERTPVAKNLSYEILYITVLPFIR